MRFLNWLKMTPLWLMMPAVGVAAVAWAASLVYEPLVFDPSLYEANQAHASELKTIDPAAIEAEGGSAGGELPGSEAVSVPAMSSVAGGALADGVWTGYAACGQGNPDNWKPYYIAVTIEVSGGRVTGILDAYGTSGAGLSWDAAENQAYLDLAAWGRGGQGGVRSQMASQIAALGRAQGIDTVSGATYSSVALFNAYADAVAKSAAAAGTAADIATQTVDDRGSQGQSEHMGHTLAGAVFADGTWVGYAACGVGNPDEWKPYYVCVSVTVEDGKLPVIGDVAGTSVGEPGDAELNWDAAENQAYLDWANLGRTRSGVRYAGVSEQVAAAIEAGRSPEGIDTVSGATYSSKSVYEAYYAALTKAAAAAGYDLAAPDPDGPSGAGQEPGGGSSGPDPAEGGDVPGDPANPSGEGGASSPELADGTYTGHAFCEDKDSPSAYSPYYLLVTIQVTGGKVSSITDISGDSAGSIDPAYRYDAAENLSYLNRAINGFGLHTKGMKAKMQAKLDAGEAVSGIDTVSGATWSSRSILEAYEDAVAQARVESPGADGRIY